MWFHIIDEVKSYVGNATNRSVVTPLASFFSGCNVCVQWWSRLGGRIRVEELRFDVKDKELDENVWIESQANTCTILKLEWLVHDGLNICTCITILVGYNRFAGYITSSWVLHLLSSMHPWFSWCLTFESVYPHTAWLLDRCWVLKNRQWEVVRQALLECAVADAWRPRVCKDSYIWR